MHFVKKLLLLAIVVVVTGSCTSSAKEDDKTAPDGLSDFGKEVVREMNRLGMMGGCLILSQSAF